MARISRKNPIDNPILSPDKVLYKTAGYARLSSEDKEFGDGGSLENQMLMIENFIRDADDLSLCSMYSDNGLTGTNFKRAGFEALLEDIRHGKINCIVVKDLSRFGREYIEAGNFLEVIFPRLGIRFISINDNYDSFDPKCQGDGMAIALKNMINSFYSKDLSTKIRAAFEVKRANFEFIGKFAPYGYVQSPENRSQFIVDDEAAQIVKRIFKMRLEGLCAYQIARQLSSEKIPTPMYYRKIKGIIKSNRHNELKPWDTSVVKGILINVVYLGHLVCNKKKRSETNTQIRVPVKDWIIKENTHEPIISQSDFNDVAELINQVTERQNNFEKNSLDPLTENIFKGFAFCADCGRVIRRITSVNKDKNVRCFTYICVSCNTHSPKNKYRHYKQEDFYNVVYAAVRQQIETCANARKMIEKIKSSKGVTQKQNNLDKEIQSIKKRLDRFQSIKLKLYNDLCDGIISEADYKIFGKEYKKEQESLASQLKAVLADKKIFNPQFVEANVWVTALEKFIETKELTREMIVNLIERIEVSGNLTTTITFRYQDEYRKLISFIEKSEVYLYE